MARRIEVDDGTSELLKSLLGSFSVKNAVAWLERKFESFDTSRAREIDVGETKNEKEYFKSARIIGFVNRLPEAKGGEVNRPVLVAVVEMKKIVTERASRLVQFNFASNALLRQAQEHPEHYRDLLIRVATYSAYFVELSRELQDDIIRRLELS